MPLPKRTHLGLRDAKLISSRFLAEGNECGEGYLDISAYKSASLGALDYLASIDAGFVGLGFEWVSADMAMRLARWKSYFLIFEKLNRLSPRAARILNTSSHPLEFPSLKRLDVEAAKYLVHDEGHHPLSIYISAGLGESLAKELIRHPHELYLSVHSLEPSVAEVLSRHQGYFLSLTSQSPISENSLRAFSGNALKCLTTDSGEYGYRLNWNTTEEWWI